MLFTWRNAFDDLFIMLRPSDLFFVKIHMLLHITSCTNGRDPQKLDLQCVIICIKPITMISLVY